MVQWTVEKSLISLMISELPISDFAEHGPLKDTVSSSVRSALVMTITDGLCRSFLVFPEIQNRS